VEMEGSHDFMLHKPEEQASINFFLFFQLMTREPTC